MAVDQAQLQNLSSMFLPAVESVNPCLILIVRRENIVGDTMEVLRKSKNVDCKKPLKVTPSKTTFTKTTFTKTTTVNNSLTSSALNRSV